MLRRAKTQGKQRSNWPDFKRRGPKMRALPGFRRQARKSYTKKFMLTIRLQRTGKRNQADFRIVLAEKTAPVQKKHLEVLGTYNPRKKNFQVNEERAKYWITQRVELSPTVHNLFVSEGLLQGAKVKAFNVLSKKAEKTEEKQASPVLAFEPSAETLTTATAESVQPTETASSEEKQEEEKN